jgi:N-acyl amino acid synthase of PEP-CTERM/exosortase system
MALTQKSGLRLSAHNIQDYILNKGPIGVIRNKMAMRKQRKEAEEISFHFSQFLAPVIANSDFKQDLASKLRHDVYCEELQYEDCREDGMETDEFDAYSKHALIQHIKSRTFAGTVRVISPESQSQLLPIEKHCLDCILDHEYLPSNFPREDICEISRLAVPSAFRRRASDQYVGAATGTINEFIDSDKELRCFPFIAVGLYFSAAALCLKLGKKHAYMMMEPKLAKSMSYVGIKFEQIGPVTEYHGHRAPYYINRDMLFANLSKEFTFMLENIRKSLYAQTL